MLVTQKDIPQVTSRGNELNGSSYPSGQSHSTLQTAESMCALLAKRASLVSMAAHKLFNLKTLPSCCCCCLFASSLVYRLCCPEFMRQTPPAVKRAVSISLKAVPLVFGAVESDAVLVSCRSCDRQGCAGAAGEWSSALAVI